MLHDWSTADSGTNRYRAMSHIVILSFLSVAIVHISCQSIKNFELQGVLADGFCQILLRRETSIVAALDFSISRDFV